jgi:flagellar hook assembly protein FlgD
VTPTFTPAPPFDASVKVYNSAGEVVAVLYENLGFYSAPTQLSVIQGTFSPDQNGQGILTLVGPGTVIVWDGTSSAGQTVQSGTYNVVVKMTDSFGKSVSWSAPLTVLRDDKNVQVEVFNSAGELVWSSSQGSGTAGSIGLSGRQLAPSSSSPGLKISYGSGPSDYVYWNGLNSQGQAVASGTYVVQVTQDTDSGKKVYAQSVIVVQASSQVFDSAIPWPNPVDPASSSVIIQLSGMAAGTEAWGDVYNLAGERVGSLARDPAGLRWDFGSNLASGIYLARVNARDAQGQQKNINLKIAILR